MRQPLVDERVVGAQQVERAAILAHDALEEELGLAAERLPQRVVEVREDALHRHDGVEVAQEQPLTRRSSRRTRRRADPPSSGGPAARAPPARRAAACVRQAQQLVVGDAAPQEERQARRELDVADAIGAPGAALAGSRSTRSRNSGLTSRRRSARSMPASKSTLRCAFAIERQQRLDVGGRDGAPIRAARERRENRPARTPSSVAPRAGAHVKIRLAARRLPGPRRHLADRRSRRCAGTRRDASPECSRRPGYGRWNGRRGVSSSADTLLRNVTTTSRCASLHRHAQVPRLVGAIARCPLARAQRGRPAESGDRRARAGCLRPGSGARVRRAVASASGAGSNSREPRSPAPPIAGQRERAPRARRRC